MDGLIGGLVASRRCCIAAAFGVFTDWVAGATDMLFGSPRSYGASHMCRSSVVSLTSSTSLRHTHHPARESDTDFDQSTHSTHPTRPNQPTTITRALANATRQQRRRNANRHHSTHANAQQQAQGHASGTLRRAR
eukprot:325189-Rhodomonas_salina.3